MKRLLPSPNQRRDLLAAVPAFLWGAYFDLTAARLDPASPLAGSELFLGICRVAGGALLAVIVLALLRSGRELAGLGRIGLKQGICLAGAVNAVTALYALTSRTVYVWDNAGYWSVARQLSEQPLGPAQLFAVFQSTVHEDYNRLLAFPVSLVMRVFGGGRAVFLFAVANLYTLPLLWALAALVRGKKYGGMLLGALFPMAVYLGMVGYVDVAACALAMWAAVVYGSGRPAVSRGVATGALLVGSFLLRRYFFFFAASFGVAALADKLSFSRRDWRDFGALAASCALCAVYFTPNFLLEKVLGTNYGDLYSAYDLGLGSDFLLLCRYFGLAVLLGLLLCAGAELTDPGRRRRTVFALLQLVVCFAAFSAVQSHGQQHLLLYLPGLALLAGQALDGPKEQAGKRRLFSGIGVQGRRVRTANGERSGRTGGALPALAAAAVFLNCFLPKAQPASVQEITRPALLPSFTFYGPRREDIEELVALSEYINGLCAGEGSRAVVLSSSFLLNSDTLTNLRPSLNLPEAQAGAVIQYHGTVDKRDAFNWNTATAGYLIVADPVQVHLGEENQQVMVLLARDVLRGEGPGANYAPLPETFSLSGDVTVRVYKRTRNWTGEDYRSISRRLCALYPAYAPLYQVPEWVQ